MNATSYTHAFTAPTDPRTAFDQAGMPCLWWNTMISGAAREVGDVFDFDVPELHHARFRVSEAVPGELLIWDVVPTYAATEQEEWLGTRLEFRFAPIEGGTRVQFTHHGLTPELDCHEVCSTAWTHHLTAGLEALLSGRGPEPLTRESADAVAKRVGARTPDPAGG